MDLKVSMEGVNSIEKTAELQDWLHQGRIKEVQKITQEERPPKPGEQGPALLAVLTVVLGAPAVVELVRSIHRLDPRPQAGDQDQDRKA